MNSFFKIKKIKIPLLFVLLTAISQLCVAQQGLLPNIMSPDAATLGKYGTFNVNYYTGVPNITIPIYKMNEKGVEIPISIMYDASGFVPNKNAGVIGLNWNLEAGGAITRVVNGAPDDRYNPNADPNDAWHLNIGFMYANKNGYPHYSSEYVRKIQFISDMNNPLFNFQYEYFPDIFSFNFLGHSGKFFMDNNGQIQVAGDQGYKVDISNLTPQYDFAQSILNVTGNVTQLNTQNYSKIVLTADDGYEFTFGGALKSLEISFSCPENSGTPIATSGQINAWYLTSVKTPDGNDILFNYQDYTENDRVILYNLFNLPGAWTTLDANFLEYKFYHNQKIASNKYGSNVLPVQNTNNNVYISLIKVAYLKEIVTDAITVKFEYDEKDKTTKFYGLPNTLIGTTTLGNIVHNRFTQRLTKIEVMDKYPNENDDIIPYYSKLFKFDYKYYGNRMFLTDINVNTDKMHYGFTYSDTASLPIALTRGIDQWGFYNGKTSNTSLVSTPVSSPEYTSDLSVTGAYRLPVSGYSTYGLLQTIVYPTGGTSQFTFEANDYSKVLNRKVSSGIVPVWENINGIAGGARIKEIKNTPGTTTSFKYIADYDINPAGSSSGLLIKNGIFYLNYNDGWENSYYLSDNDISQAASYAESHIGYKEVVEINSEGFTKYKFTNFETNPDDYSLGEDSYKISAESSISNFNNQLKRIYHYSSKEDERGKPLKTEVFDSSGNLKKTIQYTYNEDSAKELSRVIVPYVPFSFRTGQNMWRGLIQSYALYYYQNEPSKIVEADYSTNGATPVTTTTSFKYKSNTSRLITEKSTISSKGDVFTSKYKYPADYPGQEPYVTMTNSKHILSPVIEESLYKNSNQLIRSSRTNYSLWQGNTLVKPISTEIKIGSGNYQPMYNYYKYDSTGNILSYGKSHDALHSFIWDYSKSRPIAEVVNASDTDIAYTSFEAEDNSSWTIGSTIRDEYDGITGNRNYGLQNGAITKNGLTSGKKYIVSYWAKSSVSLTINGTIGTKGKSINGWTYYEHLITLSGTTVTIPSVNISIDELRLYPSDAQMTTYAYEPARGIRSICDVNNRVTYYFYDSMGRVEFIKDQDGNIIKTFEYHYKQ